MEKNNNEKQTDIFKEKETMTDEQKLRYYIERSSNVYESTYLHSRELSNIESLFSEKNKKIFDGDTLSAKKDWVRGAILVEALEESILNPVSINREFDKNRFNSIISDMYDDSERIKEFEEYYDKEIAPKLGR